MLHRTRLSLSGLALMSMVVLDGCGWLPMAGGSRSLPDVAATRVWELEPPPEQPTFVLWGTPPRSWHRPDATEEEFRRDARICLDESASARARTPREVRAAAAYYTFLDCMVVHDWEPYAVAATSIFLLRAADQAAPSEELP